MESDALHEFFDPMKPILDPRQMLIGEVGGVPVVWCLGMPDWSPLFRSFKGKVGPLQIDVVKTIGLASARAYEQERQRAEARAEIDRAKTAFFSNVSHEFRTPLKLMLGPRMRAVVPPAI